MPTDTPNVQVQSGIVHATKITELPRLNILVLLCRPRTVVMRLNGAHATTDTVTCQHCTDKINGANVPDVPLAGRGGAPNGDTWDTYRNRMIALGYAHARIELMPELTQQEMPGPEQFASAYAQAINDHNAAHPYPGARPNLSEAWQDYTETGKIN